MPNALGPNLTPETGKTHGSGSWIWLFDVNLSDTERVSIARYDAQIVWGGRTYYPFPITVPTFAEATRADVAPVRFTITDMDASIRERLRVGEIKGQRVDVTLVHSDHLADVSFYIRRTGWILGAELDFETNAATFSVGPFNVLQRKIGRRVFRARCVHRYGGPGCGYDTTRSGALSTCDRTETGANGCGVHGANEAAAGLYPYHPSRFLGAPGIPAANRA